MILKAKIWLMVIYQCFVLHPELHSNNLISNILLT